MEANVFVEVPMGSRNKYEVDAATGHVVLDRRLFTSMSYPADYGFIEGTLGDDGDPLDALVLVGEPTFPGCRIRGRVVGVFNMTDEKGSDEKIILVPLRDPTWMRVHDVHDIQPEFRDEIEHFFQVYKDPGGREDGDTRLRQPGRCRARHRGGATAKGGDRAPLDAGGSDVRLRRVRASPRASSGAMCAAIGDLCRFDRLAAPAELWADLQSRFPELLNAR
jgi:inorganic pyrophosphatase